MTLSLATFLLLHSTILPGKFVSFIHLGQQESAVAKRLGDSQGGDAAMGHDWIMWKHYLGGELDVYAVRGADDSARQPDMTIEQIRTTSPSIRTKNGIGVGSTTTEIRRKFKDAAYLKLDSVSPKDIVVWDDVKMGIAFEFDHGKDRCTAILVHPKGQGVAEVYMPYPFGEHAPFGQ